WWSGSLDMLSPNCRLITPPSAFHPIRAPDGSSFLTQIKVAQADAMFTGCEGPTGTKAMAKLIAAAFALTLATSALAMPLAHLKQANDTVITVREACGAGMHMVNGVCVRTPARRNASRCARGVQNC